MANFLKPELADILVSDITLAVEEIGAQLQAEFSKAMDPKNPNVFNLDPRDQSIELMDNEGVITPGTSHSQKFFFLIPDELGQRVQNITNILKEEGQYRKANKLPQHGIQLTVKDDDGTIYIVTSANNRWNKGYRAFFNLVNEMFESKKPLAVSEFKAMVKALKESPRFTKLDAVPDGKVVAPSIAQPATASKPVRRF